MRVVFQIVESGSGFLFLTLVSGFIAAALITSTAQAQSWKIKPSAERAEQAEETAEEGVDEQLSVEAAVIEPAPVQAAQMQHERSPEVSAPAQSSSTFTDAPLPPTVSDTPPVMADRDETLGTTPTSLPTNARAPKEPVSSERNSFFGAAKVTELKRENGVTYSIEIENSLGGKQIIEDNDADGIKIKQGADLEEEPKIAQWELGRW